MYIRQVKKQRSKDARVFYQYTLAQTSRINGKVKQHNILYLGSDKLLENKENRRLVLQMLKSLIFGQEELFLTEVSNELKYLAQKYFEKYQIKYPEHDDNNPTSIPPAPKKADYHNVDIKSIDTQDIKEFGTEHLCKQVLDKLELEQHLKVLGIDQDKIQQSLMAIISKAIYSSSEHKTAQILEMNSSLKELFNYDKRLSHKQLYHVSDLLYSHKQSIDNYLYNRISSIFDIKDKLVIFDISNTYFETGKRKSNIAKYGRSKEKRNDCPLVVFTGVINSQGFIRHSRIYEGNKPDVATIDDMLSDLSIYSPKNTEQIVVIDAGIATDKNLEKIKEKGYEYVCVSRTRIRNYSVDDTTAKEIYLTDKDRNKIVLKIFHPKTHDDTWMYVESDAKRKKENSMQDKLKQRYEEELQSIKNALSKKHGTKQINKVWERIGRAKQKHKNISSRYEVDVIEEKGKAVKINWIYIENKIKEDKTKGVYFIRTNIKEPNEKQLWEIYNTIREVESTFRSFKTDLKIRPVYHQKDERIEAHLYLTMLAYQLVNTIRHMLKQKGIHYDWTNIKRIMSTHKLQTVSFSTDKKQMQLRKPSVPIKEVKEIYNVTKCKNIQKVVKKYVVYH